MLLYQCLELSWIHPAAECWSVDPLAEPLQGRIAQKVTVLEWVEGLCEEKVLVGDTKIESNVLESMNLMVDRVLKGG